MGRDDNGSLRITKHAKERYAQRIMSRDDTDVAVYVAQNEEKIVADINKMVEFGTMLYSGLPSRTGQNPTDVYLSGFWVVLVDSTQDCVITLYRIDLGLGDEFNGAFLCKSLEEIETAKDELVAREDEVLETVEMYVEMIEENISEIDRMKKSIKSLESLNESYQDIIDNINVMADKARSKLHNAINNLIKKQEF